MTDLELPVNVDVGRVDRWVLPTDDGAGEVEVDGIFLGVSSSYRDRHAHRPAIDYAAPRERCTACRWFEPRIFRETSGDRRYLLHLAGRTVVPDERTRSRHQWLLSPHEVIENLTTRRVSANEVFLSPPAARVLALAAEFDEDLEHAYVNRAVS